MKPEETNMQATMDLLKKLKKEAPDLFAQAVVVGQWVWLEFTGARPSPQVRVKLREMGFHWSKRRRCWQHPCGTRTPNDPRETGKYEVVAATALELKDEPTQPPRYKAREFKLTTLRECALTEVQRVCDTPDKAADYWRAHIVSNPYLNQDCECFVVLLLNTRRHVKGHHLVSIGTLDTILVHPREVFRIAVISGAAAMIIMHNHPSGDPTPSEADVKVTRDLIRAGQLIKIEVLDHVILGEPTTQRSQDWLSLRELGYFY